MSRYALCHTYNIQTIVMEFHVNDEFGYISFMFNYAPCKQTIAHSQQNTANDNT